MYTEHSIAARNREFEGRVAVVTGGARGQGRSHAVELARRGADIVVCDITGQDPTVPYPTATSDDLAETVEMVEKQGRRCLAVTCDVRSSEQVDELMAHAMSDFGQIDILLANAGIVSFSPVDELTDQQWSAVVETNLGGAFRSIRAALPHMRAQGAGRIVATSSGVGRQGQANVAHYVASKWGIIGLVKAVALEVAPFPGITVNAVCPTTVNTAMIHNDATYKLFRPDLEAPTREDAEPAFSAMSTMPVPWVEPDDITEAVLFLCSDGARFVSGEVLSISAGGAALNLG